MPYVTSVERLAREEGLEQGLEKGLEVAREEGGAVVLLRQLIRKCGPLSADVEQAIRQLSWSKKTDFGDPLLDFHSLKDLTDWLANSCR